MSFQLTLAQPSSATLSPQPASPPMFIHRANTLRALVDLAAFNPELGLGIRDLTISIPSGAGLLAQTIRRALRSTPNVESLVLNLPPVVHDGPLLVGLSFPRLKKFATNLPHNVLVPLLYAHPHIETLILRVCRCIVCPLRAIGFNHLTALHCASYCFTTGIVYARLPTARLPFAPIASHLNQPLSSTRLQFLTIDYFPNERGILARIATAVPNVRRLKLNEKARAQQHVAGTLRRPWDDVPAWHRTLMRMAFLEEFMLRTFVSLSTRNRSELSVIFGWVSGPVRRPSGHPSLFRIGLIQKDWANGQQRLSHWLKRGGGEWELESTQMVGPYHSFAL